MVVLDKMKFNTPVHLELNGCTVSQGRHINEITLYETLRGFEAQTKYFVEWIIYKLDWVQIIGIEWEYNNEGKKVVTGYDGVYDMPKEVIQLLQENGLDCKEIEY